MESSLKYLISTDFFIFVRSVSITFSIFHVEIYLFLELFCHLGSSRKIPWPWSHFSDCLGLGSSNTNMISEALPPQTSKMESFVRIVNSQKPLMIVAKLSILDVCRNSWLRLSILWLYWRFYRERFHSCKNAVQHFIEAKFFIIYLESQDFKQPCFFSDRRNNWNLFSVNCIFICRFYFTNYVKIV